MKFHKSNEHISSEYCVYLEKLCIFKSQMQLFEEEQAFSDLVATICGVNKCSLEPGNQSGSIAAQITEQS